MSPCFELVIYQVKQGCAETFSAIHSEIRGELAKLPGFLDLETAVNTDNTLLRVDTVRWQDAAAAKAAFPAFARFPQAKAFMKTIDKVVFSGHFDQKGKH